MSRMKPVIQHRTALAALARVDKRLNKLRAVRTELEAEWETLQISRAFLVSQLPIPLPDGEGPSPFTGREDGTFHLGKAKDGPALDQGVAPKAGAVPHAPEILEDVAECFWATGPHRHLVVAGRSWMCLAPEEQRKKPVPDA